jgi:hypothetical protein
MSFMSWLCLATLLIVTGGAPEEKTRVTDVRAMEFDDETGKFGPELFEGKASAPPRASSANHPTRHLLVVVGLSSELQKETTIELVASEGKKSVMKGQLKVKSIVSENQFVPFLVEGVRCDPLTLKVRIVGQPTSRELVREIGFNCGE